MVPLGSEERPVLTVPSRRSDDPGSSLARFQPLPSPPSNASVAHPGSCWSGSELARFTARCRRDSCSIRFTAVAVVQDLKPK